MSLITGKVLTEARKLASFGAIEGSARALNWTMMAVLPLLLSKGDYGKIGLLVSLEILAANAFLLGLDRAVLRFYALSRNRKSLLLTVLALWAAVSLSSISVLCIAAACRSKSLFGIPMAPHILTLCAALAFLNLNTIAIAVCRTDQDIRRFAFFRLGLQSLKVLAVLGLVFYLRSSYAYIFGLFLALCVMVNWMIPFLRERAALPFDPALAKTLLKFGWPFVFHVIGANILTYVSRFVLQYCEGNDAVAVFTLAYTMGSAVILLYSVISVYFEPVIYRQAEDPAKVERWLGLYGSFASAIGALGGLAIFAVLPAVVARFYGPEYSTVLRLVPGILAASVSMPIYLQGSYRLTAHRRTHVIAAGTVFAGVMNVGMNLILIPRMGPLGAVVSFFLSHTARSIILYAVSLKAVGARNIQRGALIAPAVTIVCMCATAFATTRLVPICCLTITLVVSTVTFVINLRNRPM